LRLLLDTHVLIWVFDGHAGFSAAARRAIADGQNEVFVSAVTAWEIAIKRALGKLEVQGDYLQGLDRYRFTPLNITTEHAMAVEHLPAHHTDPFDRLLIAQAQHEDLVIVTRDERFAEYDVRIISA
jgi:PIN domain nuclease of toxin-antitoxin system